MLGSRINICSGTPGRMRKSASLPARFTNRDITNSYCTLLAREEISISSRRESGKFGKHTEGRLDGLWGGGFH